jgi:hypothetical protein
MENVIRRKTGEYMKRQIEIGEVKLNGF